MVCVYVYINIVCVGYVRVCVYVYFEYMSTHLDTNMNGLFDIYILSTLL